MQHVTFSFEYIPYCSFNSLKSLGEDISLNTLVSPIVNPNCLATRIKLEEDMFFHKNDFLMLSFQFPIHKLEHLCQSSINESNIK